jgi:hypothetical protein
MRTNAICSSFCPRLLQGQSRGMTAVHSSVHPAIGRCSLRGSLAVVTCLTLDHLFLVRQLSAAALVLPSIGSRFFIAHFAEAFLHHYDSVSTLILSSVADRATRLYLGGKSRVSSALLIRLVRIAHPQEQHLELGGTGTAVPRGRGAADEDD